MTKFALTLATALMAGLFASSAQACISCEYVPEVLKAGDAKRAKQKRLDVAAAKKKAPAQRIAKADAAPKRVTPKKVETAAAKPVETKAVAAAPATETEIETEAPAATATAALNKKPLKVAEATDSASCMKFMPTIGKTVEVPCE